MVRGAHLLYNHQYNLSSFTSSLVLSLSSLLFFLFSPFLSLLSSPLLPPSLVSSFFLFFILLSHPLLLHFQHSWLTCRTYKNLFTQIVYICESFRVISIARLWHLCLYTCNLSTSSSSTTLMEISSWGRFRT